MNTSLTAWSSSDIDAACRSEYRRYLDNRRREYIAYFAARPRLADPLRPFVAVDLAAALPDGWAEHLAPLLPSSARHRHYRSGKSSQGLALGLLGPAAVAEPDLGWLWTVLGLPPSAGDVSWRFEYDVAPALLGEQRPRVTSIDFFAETADRVVCIECKWTEAGMGTCSCARGGGNPATGRCSPRVLARPAYWATAREVFGLPPRRDGAPCPLSPSYQAVRNVAAARALADGRQAVFGLLYDATNPYFAGCGEWPGWPAALNATVADEHVQFSGLSWEAAVQHLPLDDSVRAWASDKHGLGE